MTRDEVYTLCLEKLNKSRCLLMELATGFGKSKLSIDLANYIKANVFKDTKINILILVAKTVHKQTWKDEIKKWGGIDADITLECYESLKNHTKEYFDIIILDECHHIGSETRMELLKTLSYGYILGLSATIPRKVKQFFTYNYRTQVISCDLTEAVWSEVLPEPEILLFPLKLDNTTPSEKIVWNPKAKESVTIPYKDSYPWRRQNKTKVIIQCTQKEKVAEMNVEILKEKNRYTISRSDHVKKRWLFLCGKRLEYLAYCKNDIVASILKKLNRQRTITFCKTIEQCEKLGKNCIHSKNSESTEVYNDFNNKKINHITAVNILNENANLVECKYAIFANISSSEVVIPQRLGKLYLPLCI